MSLNLAKIPDAWRWGRYDAVPAEPFGGYVFVDYSVVRTQGQPSLRIQKGGGVDPFGFVDRAAWLNEPWSVPVKPGDRIVARAWFRTDPSSKGDAVHGVRLGIDLIGYGQILKGLLAGATSENAEWVKWGTSTWTLRTFDFIVPSTAFTTDQTGSPISPTQVDAIEMWVQAYPSDDDGNVWVADAELYINPSQPSGVSGLPILAGLCLVVVVVVAIAVGSRKRGGRGRIRGRS